MSHQTFGTAPNLDDSTDARLFRLQVEAAGAVGGGANLEIVQTDDDLHGSGAAGDDIEQVDLFGHVTIHTSAAPRFRCPVRVGPFLNVTDLRDGDQSVVATHTLGIRVGVEPEVDLTQSERFRFSLFGNLNVAAGVSVIDSDVLIEEFDSTATTLGAEIGLRGSMPGFTLALAFLHRSLNVADSDVAGGFFVKKADYDFSGVQFSLGVRW